ncbi:MAG: hypothetical protein ABIJ92_01405 [Candidatus Aenigmatarchaeota archaeon]
MDMPTIKNLLRKTKPERIKLMPDIRNKIEVSHEVDTNEVLIT